MRILHISDTHGLLPEPPDSDEFDVVVHSGDMMPNRTFGIRVIEEAFQRSWIEEHVWKFSARYWGKPFIYTPGNHDYFDPTPVMREAGIDAQLACEGLVVVNDVRFWGHPWTPEFFGWNWMCNQSEMAYKLEELRSVMAGGGIDVLISHGPMRGVLDRNRSWEFCGCPELLEAVYDAVGLRALLHGHIHESSGVVTAMNGMIVSNAACTSRIVEIFKNFAVQTDG